MFLDKTDRLGAGAVIDDIEPGRTIVVGEERFRAGYYVGVIVPI
jgi:hypothetical protein